MAAPQERRDRAARAALVLAALLFHGWALDRMSLGLLSSVALVAGLAAGWRPKLNRDAIVILCATAAFLGGSDLLVEPTPDGAVPSVVLSPLTLVLVVLSVGFTLARKTTPAWTAALLLVVLSCSVPPVNPLNLVGPVTMAVVLVAVPTIAWRGPWRWDRAAAVGITLAVTAAGAGGLTMASAWAEGLLMPVFEAWVAQNRFGGGLSMQPGVSLKPLSTVSGSDRVLMELSGPAPDTLRTQVMDRFDGERWTSSEDVATMGVRAPASAGPTVPLELTFFARLTDVVPAPAGLVSVEGEDPAFDQAWLVTGGGGRGEVVQLERSVSERLPTEAIAPSDELTWLPEGLASELAPFAAAIAGDAAGAEAKARAIEGYLVRHHQYSLTADLRGEAHPLVVLLRDQRAASCGYFASAMAALLRTEGIPTRLAGGFAPRDTNPWTGRTPVRSRDAHAWVEVWVPERGAWIAFDPTPWVEADPGPSSAWLGMLDAARRSLHRLLVRLQGHPDEVIEQAMGSWPTIAIAALLTTLFGWRWARRNLAGRGRRERGARDRKLWPHYRRYLRILRRRGIRPHDAEPDEALLARVGEQLGDEVREAAAAFMRAYQRARYGDGGSDELRPALAVLARAVAPPRAAPSTARR